MKFIITGKKIELTDGIKDKIYKKLGISTEEAGPEETVSVENAAGVVMEDQQAENTETRETSTAAARAKSKKG